MTPRLDAFLLAATLAAPAAADLCSSEDETLLWASCGDEAAVDLILMPEGAGPTPDGALDVTGVYTATDRREGDRPKPVGLFVHEGDVIGREYVRFDGVLVVDAEGRPTISHRRRAQIGDQIFDLEDPAARSAFLSAAAAAGASVAQSHLLVIDGAVDAFAKEGAPAFRRRILFQLADGSYGVYDSTPRVLTLAEATEDVAARFAPAMAINLDMGSFDFCRRGPSTCGALSEAGTAKLSNILRFRGG
ncbi:MAG: hypothetical protein AAF322_12755 [Pseudomonadota bacterium]